MSSPKVLTCPACGAKLNITGDEAQVQCEYCGNTIVVPEELRSPKAEPVSVNPQVVIVQTNPETIRTVTAATTAVTAGTSI